MSAEIKHLWQIDHPYYAPDGYENKCESLAELMEDVNACDEDMNHIYRFDWYDPADPCQDRSYLSDEERRAPQTLTVHMVQPRKSRFISFSCPVTHDDEPAVLAWLRGPRVLGALATLWEPLLDAQVQA